MSADPDSGAERWIARRVPPELERAYVDRGWWTDDTFGALVARQLARHPASTISVWSRSRPWRGLFSDIDDEARRLVTLLRELGVQPGATVAFQLPNWREALVSFAALALGGYVAVPIVHIYAGGPALVDGKTPYGTCSVDHVSLTIKGWDECLEALDRVQSALRLPSPETDPCLATGEGWIAEEALATGLLCFLLFVDEPVTALRRAACTSGDSDSIACLAGAFAGAYHGPDAWPAEWADRIEYQGDLVSLGALWDA